jgi:hypothetical protein
MSNLKPSMIALDKGLNLQTAKIAAPPGSVLNSLNYEQVDFQGQKRIDGYARYDGSLAAAVDDYIVIEFENPTSYFEVGMIVSTADGMLGVVVDVEDEWEISVAVLNEKVIPVKGDVLFDSLNQTEADGQLIDKVSTGKDSGVSSRRHYLNLLDINNALRNKVEELPGPIAGLHWFRDRLHAVASLVYLSLDGTTPAIYPGDTVRIAGSGDGDNTATVLDAFTLAGTRAVFLDAMIKDQWPVDGQLLDENSNTLGTILEAYEKLDDSPTGMASLFEARSEAQAINETAEGDTPEFGWKFIHLGWKVLFNNGISLYGSIPAINQNIEGVGTLGPTPITDNNGAPASVSQGVAIDGAPAQVSGWKSVSANTSYNPVPSDIQDSDDEGIYADAYISWDAGTGQVVGDTGTLVEYSPTNTVRISA